MYRIWIWWRSGLFCIAQSIVFLFQTCCRLQIWFDQIWTLCLESLVKSQCFEGFLSWILIVSNSNSTNISGAVTLYHFLVRACRFSLTLCMHAKYLKWDSEECWSNAGESYHPNPRYWDDFVEGWDIPSHLIQNMMKGSLQKMEIYVRKVQPHV